MSAPLWTPSRERREGANLTRYARWLAEHRALDLPEYDYQALWRWSVDHLEDCYASLWDYFAIDSDAGYERVLGRAEMPGAQWFPGARVNYAEHVFRGKPDDAVAVQFASETAPVRAWTWRELRPSHRGDRRRAARRGRRRRRPGGGVPAQPPRGARRGPRLHEHRRRLVGLLARLRGAQRGGPVRPDRTGRPARRRRLRVRGQALRPPRRGAGPAGGPAERAPHGGAAHARPPGRPRRHARHGDLGGVRATRRRGSRSRGCRGNTRSGSSTPPAPPGCPSRSCTRTSACSSTSSRPRPSTSTPTRVTACSGSPRRAG